MSDKRRKCPNCGAELALGGLEILFVHPDGCRLWAHDRNVRTRDTLGSGEGSLEDERARDVRTPWTSKEHKQAALVHLDSALLAFARSLPYVKVEHGSPDVR